MSRTERLVKLIAALLTTERPLTADEIHERVEGYPPERASFRRQFERDKETLREQGVPIHLEPIETADGSRAEGYRIPKDEYYLPDPGLTADELAALHLAATAVHLEGGPGASGLWKLGGTVPVEGPRPPVAALPGTEQLAPLFGAIAARRPVTFRYRGEERAVDPHRLSFRNGHWYLAGFDHARGEARSYRLDRFESAVVAGDPGAFVPPAALDEPSPPWLLGEDEPVTASLLIDANQAGWAIDQMGDDAVVERRPDGGAVLAVPVTNRDAFRSFVLGFLDHAEVLGPADLRAELVAWLEAQCPA